MSRKTLTIALVPTTRTDLLCIACGRFRTELAVAVVGSIDGADLDVEPVVGVHNKCTKSLRRKRATPAPSSKAWTSQKSAETGDWGTP